MHHDHPCFADTSFQPCGIVPERYSAEWDSTIVHDHGPCFTCHECGFTVVDRKGQTCGICKSYWLWRARHDEPAVG